MKISSDIIFNHHQERCFKFFAMRLIFNGDDVRDGDDDKMEEKKSNPCLENVS
jgi:hypothetical protein